MKIFFRALLVLVVASAGLAWGAGGSAESALPAPSPDIQQPERTASDVESSLQSEAIPVEHLLSPDFAATFGPIDCIAACDQEREACIDACNFNIPCIRDCHRVWRRCTRRCIQ